MQSFHVRHYATINDLCAKGIREFVETALRISGSSPIIRWKLFKLRAGEIVDDGLRKVTAYPMEHPLECYGYRIEEHDKPGALNAQALKDAGVQTSTVPGFEKRQNSHAGRRSAD